MQHPITLHGIILVLLVVIPASTGCGGSGDSSSVLPSQSPAQLTEQTLQPVGTGSATLSWGTWIIHCEDATDDKPASVEAIPIRSADLHYDVVSLLEPPQCTNCMEIEIVSVVDLDWTFLITLTNPTLHTAYDVRGVFPGTEGPTILNPSSYTNRFDIDGDADTHNPYVVFETDNEYRAWHPAETFDQTFTFRRAPGETFVDLIYAVAASWPDPQDEIVELANPQVSGPLYTDTSEPVTFTVDVIDWQDDIEYVLIDLSPVNGSAYTHFQDIGDGIWEIYSYAAWGLSPGTAELQIAAKSLGANKLTFNFLTVEIQDPPQPQAVFDLFSGPTSLEGECAPTGEQDLAVIGRDDGTSSTLVHASSTAIYGWDETYNQSSLFVSLVEPDGGDPNFPIDPVSRIAVPNPMNPYSPGTFSVLQTNLDTDIWDDTTDPVIPYRNTLQLLDLQQSFVVDFKLTADNPDTDELDAIMRPADVASGVNGYKYGYALWAPDGGANPLFYPYIALVRYEPPYKDGIVDYDRLIGGIDKGAGAGRVQAENITGLAVWDGDGDGNIVVAVSEGGSTEEVEIFTADYLANPEGYFTPVATLTGFVGTPVDVAILPVGDAGFETENWLLILTDMKTVEVHTVSGDFVESFHNTDALPGTPLHMDVDLENLRVHVLMDGPVVSVLEYAEE